MCNSSPTSQTLPSHLEAELHAEGGDGKEPGVEGVVVPESVAERYGKHEERQGHQQHGEMAAKRGDVGGAEGHQDGVGHAVDEVQDGRQQKAHVPAQADLWVKARQGQSLRHVMLNHNR